MKFLSSLYGPFLLAPLLLAGACEDGAAKRTTTAADNTAINARDRGDTATPMDQSNDAADLDTTQKIRQALMADDSLSTDAKNAKIITANGVVVLRGPVTSAAEKTSLETKARELAGSYRVENHLDVVASK